MTLLFSQNLGFAWGTQDITGGGAQTRITYRLIVQDDGDGLEEILK